jgi:UDP-N-acetylmuramoyl-L-alanyl-D-glutamate--2,6-diaminopimelate ligase
VDSSQEVPKRVSELAAAINTSLYRGSPHTTVRGLAYDSREVGEGFLFFALPGIHTDGHRFIPAALDAGAAAVVHSEELAEYREGIAYLKVENPRTVMSPIAAEFYGHPSRGLVVAGVTGTDGKSSTVSYLRQLLDAAGEKCGFLSTVEFHDGETLRKNVFRQSTPEPPEVHKLLREMTAAGCGFAVVEATSHGLSPRNNRLGDVEFSLGILTNISHEHLEFHGSMRQYAEDKSRLFMGLTNKRGITAAAVLPAREKYLPLFTEAADGTERILYGSGTPEADYNAVDLCEDDEGISFILETRETRLPCRLPLQGLFNVDNALAALAGAARLLNRPVEKLVPYLEELEPVRGRMQPVRAGQPFGVLVDYAHSPGSFEKLFPLLRRRAEGRLIALFGSAGERDREKRPIQGRIAAEYADIIVLCDEDPRMEESAAILEDIAAGCVGKTRGENLFLISDRRAAIRHACSLAAPGDLLVCLGKGHEGSILGPDGSLPWNEEEALLETLEEAGYR